MPRNNAKRWVVMAVILMVAGIAMMTAGIAIDEYDSYWMILVGLMLFLTFLICFFIFVGQANRLDRMFRGKELLAHWRFAPDEKQRKAKTEYQERKARHKIMLLIITAFFVVIGGLFVVFGFDDGDEAMMFIAIMGGAYGIIAFAALVTPGMAYRGMQKSPPDVYVGPYAAWVMGQYAQWKAPMTRIRRIDLTRGKTGAVIEVWFLIWQRYGYQQHVCRIPAPDGMDQEARRVAMELASTNGVPFDDKTDGQDRIGTP